MMNAKNITDDQLLDYLDGTMASAEKKEIEKLLKRNKEVLQRFNELKQVDTILSAIDLRSPSANFAFTVMKSVDKAQYRVKKGGIIIVITAMLTVLLGAYFTVGDLLSLSIIEEQDYFPRLTDYLPEAINLKTLSSSLLIILSVFSLLIFDKTVLKPMFKRRGYHY